MPNILSPAFGNSFVVFGSSRQPARLPVLWTPNPDRASVQLENNIRFNITFWILNGTFATHQTNAASAVLAVNNAYVTEKAGLRIAWCSFGDRTDHVRYPDAMALLNGGSEADFRNKIGFNPREINVYVITNVLRSPNMALNFEGLPVILMGQSTLTFPQLLEHEIGHAFVLWHTDGLPGFNLENVMPCGHTS